MTNLLTSPLIYLALGMGFHIFSPDVGSVSKLFQDASQLSFFLAALVYDPAMFTRFLVQPGQAETRVAPRAEQPPKS